jgi:putative ABC transport system permease protein
MLQDIRLALRTFLRTPGFAALAILILALGSGANAAVLAVVRAVLLKPLPYADPERLVSIGPGSFFSNADLLFLRARTRSFSHVATSSPGWTMSLIGAGDPVQITAAKPSANLFEMLGVHPLHGRLFRADEATPGRHRVVVLGHTLWQARFGGDPAAIGRVVTLDGDPHEIIGILAPASDVLDIEADAWVPLPFDPASPFYRGRTSLAYARLRPGIDVDAATRELQALLPDMRRELGYANDFRPMLPAVSLHSSVVGEVRTPLLIIAAAVGLLIFLTAANLGTLLLGRQVVRRREAAVRAALGASSWRLVRQTAAENIVLAILGGLAGVAAAAVALPALVRLLPPEMPRLPEVGIDGVVFVTVLAAAAGAVLIFGVVPASIGVPATMQPLLRLGAQTDTRGGRRALDVLVAAQVAMAVVLGIAASLMVRSMWALQRVDPGFAPDRVLSLKLQPAGERYRGPGRLLAYYRDVLARVGAVPGVAAAGVINHLPLSGYNWVTGFQLDEKPVPPGVSPPNVGWRMIEGRYLSAMGIPLRAGRSFDVRDDVKAPPVAIVNEALARRYFGAPMAAIGRVIRMTSATGEQRATIVGVVGDVRHRSIAIEPEPEIYRPVAQNFGMAMALVVRVDGPPASAAAAVREAVWSVDRNVAIAEMGAFTTIIRESLGRPRLMATLLFVFAAVGLVIVLSGVYGVVAYSVRRREREMGIRLALGAKPASVRSLVLRQGAIYAAVGLVIGIPLTFPATSLMRGVLFGIRPHDMQTFVVLSFTIAATVVAATVFPALRAAKVDPAAVLKAE